MVEDDEEWTGWIDWSALGGGSSDAAWGETGCPGAYGWAKQGCPAARGPSDVGRRFRRCTVHIYMVAIGFVAVSQAGASFTRPPSRVAPQRPFIDTHPWVAA
jgi:hypothetical protein